jgi:predicted nucleotidyltransferase
MRPLPDGRDGFALDLPDFGVFLPDLVSYVLRNLPLVITKFARLQYNDNNETVMGEKLKSILSELQEQLQALYGPRLVRLVLYGSQARGDAAPGSDIDVMVVLVGPVSPVEEIHRTSKIIAGLSLKYDEVLSCSFISQEELATERSSFLMNVQREGVVL